MRARIWMIAGAAMAVLGCQQQAQAPAGNVAAPDAPAKTAATAEVALAKSAIEAGLQWGPCPEGMPEGCGIAVLHGDPAKPNADIFLRVPGGSAIPPHSHSSAERIILVSGELDVKYQGTEPASLRTGSYAYGPAGMPHRADCRSAGPCTLFIAFEKPVDVQPFDGSL